MQAVVLAAGFGKRMGRFKENPKALLEIGGRPVIDHLLSFLGEAPGIDGVSIRTNGLYYPLFKEWLKRSEFTGFVELCSNGATDDQETCGAVGDLEGICSKKGISEDFILTAADSIFDFSILPFFEFGGTVDGDTVAVMETDDRKALKRGGVVDIAGESRVIGFEEKPSRPRSNLLALPLYRVSRDTIPQINRYLMEDGNDREHLGSFFAWSYRRRPLYAYRIDGERHHITDMPSYEKTASLFEKKART